MISSSAEVRESLFALSARYAMSVDRRRLDTFLEAFHPDATLTVYRPSDAPEPTHHMRGHEEMGRVIDLIAVYPKTYHLLGQGLYDIGDQLATGEVYCLAHHYSRGGQHDQNYVMHIRYQDEYRTNGDGDGDGDGEWRIASRVVQVDWTETRDLPRPDGQGSRRA
jgi:hypothetical protein